MDAADTGLQPPPPADDGGDDNTGEGEWDGPGAPPPPPPVPEDGFTKLDAREGSGRRRSSSRVSERRRSTHGPGVLKESSKITDAKLKKARKISMARVRKQSLSKKRGRSASSSTGAALALPPPPSLAQAKAQLSEKKSAQGLASLSEDKQVIPEDEGVDKESSALEQKGDVGDGDASTIETSAAGSKKTGATVAGQCSVCRGRAISLPIHLSVPQSLSLSLSLFPKKPFLYPIISQSHHSSTSHNPLSNAPTTASGAPRRASTTEGYIAAEEPICFGKLSKQGKHAHSWHRRWFVLRPSKLEYFKSRDQFFRRSHPKGSILLENIFNIERDMSKEFCLRLSIKHPKDDGWKAIHLQ